MGFNERSTAVLAQAGPQPRIAAWKWQVVWLMFLATVFNYMDRQTLQSTATFIKKEFDLNEQWYGWLDSAFGLSYATFQLFAGSLADRFKLRWLYAGALLVWSAAGFFTGFAQTVAMLMACRVVLGIGEAFNWPCAVTAVHRLIPREARSLANGIFHSGVSIGAATTPLLVVALVGAQGEHWRLVFQIIGAAGLVWVALWFWCLRGERAAEVDAPADTEDVAAQPDSARAKVVPFWHVFSLRQFWITLAISIAVNICWHFYRVWLPRLLERDLGFSPRDLQYILVGFYLSADLGSLSAGYVTRRLTQAGLSVERARQTVLIGTALLCLLSAPAALLGNPWITVPLIFVVAAGSMGGFPNLFALAQEVSAQHTARCVGLIGAVAWFFLAAMQPVVGGIVDQIGTFVPLLIAVGFVPLLGALTSLFWPRQAEQANRGRG